MSAALQHPTRPPQRRPIASRSARWSRSLARCLASLGARPNQVSLASIGFGGAAGLCLAATGFTHGTAAPVALLLAAAMLIQLRLLCNMLDGLIAVEGELGSPIGEIYNEVPDRAADVLIFIGTGYAMAAPAAAAWMPTLGYVAALLAVLTAYVRAVGAGAGTRQHFVGPMAKPHRMAVMTAACLVTVVEVIMNVAHYALPAALAIVIVGSAWTFARRLKRIARDIHDGAA